MRSEPASPIPLSEPELSGREWEYLQQCLDTGWVSSAGAFVEDFEGRLGKLLLGRPAVATTSGTTALHIALLVSGVQPGDEVLVSSLTFVAPANAVRYAGAHPVFVDADRATWQMDTALLASYLVEDCRRESRGLVSRRTGRRVGALLPVHILGHPVDMDPICELARDLGLPVVEDATESLGASYRGTPVGAIGDAACLSFNGNKLITTGGGGMFVTRHEEWAGRARYLTTQAKDDPVEYVHGEVGYNYRLTNMQAALGCAQAERLAEFVEAKRRIAARYREALAGLTGVDFMPSADWADPVYWLSTVLVHPEVVGCDRHTLRSLIAERGIDTRPLWQPLHRSPAHRGALALGGAVADDLQARALSLPSSTGLAERDQGRVIEAMLELAATH